MGYNKFKFGEVNMEVKYLKEGESVYAIGRIDFTGKLVHPNGTEDYLWNGYFRDREFVLKKLARETSLGKLIWK